MPRVDLDVEIADDKKLQRLEKLLQTVSPEDVRPFINTLFEQPSSDFDWLQIASRAHQIKVEKREWELMKAKKEKSRATGKDSLDANKQVSYAGFLFKLFFHLRTTFCIQTNFW